MPSKKLEPPLHIELRPSRQLLILLLTIHSGAALFTMFFAISWAIKGLILGLLAAGAMISLYKSGWIDSTLLSRTLLRWQHFPNLVWQSDNDWQLSTRSGEDVLAQLLPASTCWPMFTALNFRAETNRRVDRYFSVVIFADAIDPEIFRQLRVRLRTRFVQEPNN